MWVRLSLVLCGIALFACAHGGGEIFPSPTLNVSDVRLAGTSDPPTIESPTPSPASLSITEEAVIDPDPAALDIRSVPTCHHAVDLVSLRSAVITASFGGAPVIVHNDGELLGEDGCKEVNLAPEGDTRLTIIVPESGKEVRSRFYLVGCAPGPATLTVMSEGELLNVYEFTVLEP